VRPGGGGRLLVLRVRPIWSNNQRDVKLDRNVTLAELSDDFLDREHWISIDLNDSVELKEFLPKPVVDRIDIPNGEGAHMMTACPRDQQS
jgi:hypothetical protein